MKHVFELVYKQSIILFNNNKTLGSTSTLIRHHTYMYSTCMDGSNYHQIASHVPLICTLACILSCKPARAET